LVVFAVRFGTERVGDGAVSTRGAEDPCWANARPASAKPNPAPTLETRNSLLVIQTSQEVL
jgi:hypothetical protein